jgi:F-type H+-transporting ATPase subunit b
MNDLLSQLGNLFLGAIPTGVLLGFVWLGYRVIVQGKLTSVLSERRQHTEGAVEKSRAAISAAEARSAEYEQRIRDAKLAIYKAQELRRRKQLEARVAQLAEAHQAAEIHLQSGRRAIDAELRRAKAGLEMHVNALVNQIVRAVLEPATDSAVTEVKR